MLLIDSANRSVVLEGQEYLRKSVGHDVLCLIQMAQSEGKWQSRVLFSFMAVWNANLTEMRSSLSDEI